MSVTTDADPTAPYLANARLDLLSLKRPVHQRNDALTRLRADVAARADALRARKAEFAASVPTAERYALHPLIRDLLELKFLDADNADCVVRRRFAQIFAAFSHLFFFFPFFPFFLLTLIGHFSSL